MKGGEGFSLFLFVILQAPDVPAQVGFDAGMDRHHRSYMLPGSGRDQISDIAK